LRERPPGVAGTNLAIQDRRQQQFGQPRDTRVFGAGRLEF
jgi:hypothetical protein